jgi:hypothetical protein
MSHYNVQQQEKERSQGCESMSHYNVQQQERSQGCENMSNYNMQQQERSQECENMSHYNDQQQEMSQGCENMSHYNEPLQERTQRCEHVSQDNGQWHGERKLLRWRASAYMGTIYFISPVAYGMSHVYTVVDTFIFPIQLLGLGRNVALMAAFLLPVPTLRKI